jgi:hypothetical protein
MRMSLVVLALCISSASAASKAASDLVTARDMLANPQDEHNRTYLQGVWDGLRSANVTLRENHQDPLFCTPPALDIPLDQVIEILKRHIGHDSGPFMDVVASMPVDGELLDALQEVFPCPPGKR